MRFAVVLAFALVFARPSAAAEALVAVAANFAGAAEALARDYEALSGHDIVLTTGATGKLYAQVAQGAPFAIFLSADAKTPERLEAEGLAIADSRFTYAVGRLTIWSAAVGVIGADAAASLRDGGVRFIAIANPDLAPYGVAAREALQALGLWDEVQPRIVLGQNIGQVFSLADTGAAQAAFIATSALDAPGSAPRGSRFDVPQSLFSPILQDAVLLNAGKDNEAAEGFLDYLRSDAAKTTIRTFGYGLP
ncbi:MAG: molybdate ABC transporter substrate-binding protein [Rhizobiaceae bacterium]|nr:molybdate ABC transporter substrate-binding protein [Rhizobiaceae bacterium]